jgi:thiopurine S-methyltransferase
MQPKSNPNPQHSLAESFWTGRYDSERTGWDIGYVSTPLKAYIDQLRQRDLRVLIPGCGNAYEGFYLWARGFRRLSLIDLSERPVQGLRQAFEQAYGEGPRILHGDFFEHTGTYDLILEQTFFCALPPEARPAYARKMHALLAPAGRLVGVLFNRRFEHEGPPFGGDADEYRTYFEGYFRFHAWAPCTHSIPPRQGMEWWMNLQKAS